MSPYLYIINAFSLLASVADWVSIFLWLSKHFLRNKIIILRTRIHGHTPRTPRLWGALGW
jgi:hypothetical protein